MTDKPQSNLPKDRPWDIDEVAAYLGVHPNTVRNRIEDSGLPFVKFGRVVRFIPEQVDAWLIEHTEAA